MSDNICYCGSYGGGVHTRSARCGQPLLHPDKQPLSSAERIERSLDVVAEAIHRGISDLCADHINDWAGDMYESLPERVKINLRKIAKAAIEAAAGA